jgi:hypothetical protein
MRMLAKEILNRVIYILEGKIILFEFTPMDFQTDFIYHFS